MTPCPRCHGFGRVRLFVVYRGQPIGEYTTVPCLACQGSALVPARQAPLIAEQARQDRRQLEAEFLRVLGRLRQWRDVAIDPEGTCWELVIAGVGL